jgi:hypothetical protein
MLLSIAKPGLRRGLASVGAAAGGHGLFAELDVRPGLSGQDMAKNNFHKFKWPTLNNALSYSTDAS